MRKFGPILMSDINIYPIFIDIVFISLHFKHCVETTTDFCSASDKHPMILCCQYQYNITEQASEPEPEHQSGSEPHRSKQTSSILKLQTAPEGFVFWFSMRPGSVVWTFGFAL